MMNTFNTNEFKENIIKIDSYYSSHKAFRDYLVYIWNLNRCDEQITNLDEMLLLLTRSLKVNENEWENIDTSSIFNCILNDNNFIINQLDINNKWKNIFGKNAFCLDMSDFRIVNKYMNLPLLSSFVNKNINYPSLWSLLHIAKRKHLDVIKEFHINKRYNDLNYNIKCNYFS